MPQENTVPYSDIEVLKRILRFCFADIQKALSSVDWEQVVHYSSLLAKHYYEVLSGTSSLLTQLVEKHSRIADSAKPEKEWNKEESALASEIVTSILADIDGKLPVEFTDIQTELNATFKINKSITWGKISTVILFFITVYQFLQGILPDPQLQQIESSIQRLVQLEEYTLGQSNLQQSNNLVEDINQI